LQRVHRYVKLWDFQQLSDADSGEDSQYFFLKPLEEVALGTGVRVRGLVWQAEGRWLINDEAGSLIQVLFRSRAVMIVVSAASVIATKRSHYQLGIFCHDCRACMAAVSLLSTPQPIGYSCLGALCKAPSTDSTSHTSCFHNAR